MQNGLIHIYCGDGKGKTTAAVGLGARAWGRGKRVLFVQFLKSEDSGERRALACLPGFEMTECPKQIKFTFAMNEEERTAAQRDSMALFDQACRRAQKDCDLLILDEIFGAISTGMVSAQAVLEFLKQKPEGLEVVLTGRDPAQELIELADYATELCKRKHPFDAGVPARIGIEY